MLPRVPTVILERAQGRRLKVPVQGITGEKESTRDQVGDAPCGVSGNRNSFYIRQDGSRRVPSNDIARERRRAAIRLMNPRLRREFGGVLIGVADVVAMGISPSRPSALRPTTFAECAHSETRARNNAPGSRCFGQRARVKRNWLFACFARVELADQVDLA